MRAGNFSTLLPSSLVSSLVYTTTIAAIAIELGWECVKNAIKREKSSRSFAFSITFLCVWWNKAVQEWWWWLWTLIRADTDAQPSSSPRKSYIKKHATLAKLFTRSVWETSIFRVTPKLASFLVFLFSSLDSFRHFSFFSRSFRNLLVRSYYGSEGLFVMMMIGLESKRENAVSSLCDGYAIAKAKAFAHIEKKRRTECTNNTHIVV